MSLNNYFPQIKNRNKALPLQLSFLIFSMLLNCMGIVILKFSEENISYSGLGLLEAFKDLPIALVSLFAVNYINKIGTKRTLLISLILILVSCIFLPFLGNFWFFKIWFAIIGVSFAIGKISIFGLIRINVEDEKQMSSLMNRVEAAFMVGIFCVNIGFGWLLSTQYAEFWKFGFWFIALITIINIVLFWNTDYLENKLEENLNFKNGIAKLFNKKTVLFLAIIFLIVFLEQCFNSWLPTFYKNNLKVNSFFALQSAAFMSLFSFLGRIITSKLIKKINWSTYIFFCLSTIIFLLWSAQIILQNAPNTIILIMLFPILGLFIAPLYPLYNSKILMNFEKSKTNLLISIIVIFSSLGSSAGSVFMSLVFQYKMNDKFALFASIPAIIIFTLTIIFIKSIVTKKGIN